MEISPAVEAVIWDLDGTLLDSFDIFCHAIGQATTVLKMPLPSRDVIISNYHGSLEESIQAVLQIGPGNLLSDVVDEFLIAQHDFYQHPDTCLFPDAIKLAQRIGATGLHQFIITNRAHAGRGLSSPRRIVEDSELNGLISKIICGDETVARKPNAKVAWPILEQYALDPETLLVIGDQHVDAELAYNLGCHAVIVGRDGQSPHLEKIPNWRSFATSVTSLETVVLG